MAKINIKKFEKACRGDPKGEPGYKDSSRGIITTIAKRLSVARNTVYSFIEKNKKAKIIYEEESNLPQDIAENIVFSRMTQERDLKAAEIFLLKHKKGRERGYGEHKGIEHSGKIVGIKWEDEDGTGIEDEEIPKAEDSMENPHEQDTH
jgi:hypothetical protein